MLALFQDPLGQMPPAASTFASDVDRFYTFVWAVCAFFFLLITAVLVYSVIRWRRRKPNQPPASAVTHNTALEVVWTVIPLVIVMVIFAWGWKGSLDMAVAPRDAMVYQVVGQQWNWTIEHPDGESATNEMYVPAGVPVRVDLFSRDVIHSFSIPAFRVKRDVLPGRFGMVWFQATKPGTYPLFCTEYCGREHAYMIGKVHVLEKPREFFEQPGGERKPWHPRIMSPVERGKQIYNTMCIACHSLDGSPRVGPSWKGLWGSTEELADGSKVVVDEPYVAESIRNPSAKITKGYENVAMSPFPQLKDEDIKAVIEFMKTLK